MSDIKWIKVTVDMFEDSKIEFLRSLPEGDSIIVIWLQMLSIAGKSNANGYLMITDGIPYTEQLLCNTLRRNPVLMQFAVETFMRLKMINIEDGPFHITRWEKHQNVEQMVRIKSDGAIRQARYRENQKIKLLLEQKSDECDVTNDVTKCHSNAQEVRSKSKEKEYKHIGVFESYTSNQELIETLNLFLEFRKKLKSPMTEHAVKLMLGNLDKLSSNDNEKIEVLNQSIVNGWKGLFAVKNNNRVITGVNPILFKQEPKEKEVEPYFGRSS